MNRTILIAWKPLACDLCCKEWGFGFRVTISNRKKHSYCRPVINKPPPFKAPKIRIPIIIPITGKGGY